MIEFPAELSPLGTAEDSLAEGPFVVEKTDETGTRAEIGFHLQQDAGGVFTWRRMTSHPPLVTPTDEPAAADGTVVFMSGADRYVFRPFEAGDEILAGLPAAFAPASKDEEAQFVKALASQVTSGFYNGPPETSVGDSNLYMTRGADGSPIALVKMSASHSTLVRRDGRWDVLGDDEDDLFGDNDIPVRESAVSAWDAGDMQKLESLLLDDRFSPADVMAVWVELAGDSDKIERLLIERSRDRFYERTKQGTWASASPKEDAVTLDVVWGAISAWDEGDLTDLGAAEQYDEEGDVA